MPKIYFSFRSPYSWLALHDLAKSAPGVLDDAELYPFWEPDARSEALLAAAGGHLAYVPMSPEKHRYVLGDVRRLARRRGLDVTWPPDRDPWWEPSHLTYLAVASQGRGREFIDLVHSARWQQGRDISEQSTIEEIVTSMGLPRETVSAAVHSDAGRAAGAQAQLAAFKDDVFGVPYFMNRRQRFWGVDRLPDFLESLAADPSAARMTDAGHAGGCGLFRPQDRDTPAPTRCPCWSCRAGS
jgi:2-hydroxychromene-2-carboxylate isomerase